MDGVALPRATVPGMTAIEWLPAQPLDGKRSKDEIDASLAAQRDG